MSVSFYLSLSRSVFLSRSVSLILKESTVVCSSFFFPPSSPSLSCSDISNVVLYSISPSLSLKRSAGLLSFHCVCKQEATGQRDRFRPVAPPPPLLAPASSFMSQLLGTLQPPAAPQSINLTFTSNWPTLRSSLHSLGFAAGFGLGPVGVQHVGVIWDPLRAIDKRLSV